jgi:hypothetical protein
MLHLCLYLNIEAEEYIWAEQTKVEIHKLPWHLMRDNNKELKYDFYGNPE